MKKIVLMLFLAAGLVTRAQQPPPSKPFIEVTGTSEMEIVPDEIFISITLRERDRMPIDRQESDMKNELKDIGIDLSNLTLKSADVDFRRMRAFKKESMVTKRYQLKVPDAEMIGKVYERLDKLDAEDAFISKFTHSRIREFYRENRVKAVREAKDKAEYMLQAVNRQTGDPLQITEQESYIPSNDHMAKEANASLMRSGQDAPAEQIGFRKIKLRSTVYAKFEIR